MREITKLPLSSLWLLISFAAVNAVMFTPALPGISDYFKVSDKVAQLSVTLFLLGYAIGQLLYGPLSNRFGRKPALYIGISVQIKQLKKATFEPLVKLGRTLYQWKDEIVRMWRFTKNNGITEGFHRKMKLIQRRAYGFRNFENYRLRVKVLCS